MIQAGECPLCQGTVGFRYFQGQEKLLLICEECGHLWPHPARMEPAQAEDPLHPGFARRHPGLDLRQSRWADREEIERVGWGAYLLTPGQLSKTEGEEGQEKTSYDGDEDSSVD